MASDQYSISDYLAVFLRRRKLFLVIFAAIAVTAMMFAIVPPDVYQSTGEMRIDLEGPNIQLLEPVVLTTYADQYIDSLEQRVVAQNTMEPWIEEIDELRESAAATSVGEVLRDMYDSVRIGMVVTPLIDQQGRDFDVITGFRVGYAAHSPELAHKVAMKLSEAFLEADRATRRERAMVTSDFLETQIEQKRAEVVRLEGAIADFKQQNGERLPEFMALHMTALDRTERELEGVEAEIRTLEQDRIFRSSQLAEMRQRTADDFGAPLEELRREYLRAVSLYGPEHPDVVRMQSQLRTMSAGDPLASGNTEILVLEAQLAAAKQRYSDEHPDVIKLQRQLDTLRRQPSQGSRQANDPAYMQLVANVNAIQTQINGLRSRASELREKRAETENRMAGMPQVEREYQALLRDSDTAKRAYDDLQGRLEVAQQTQALESGETAARLTQIYNPSLPSEPAGPRRLATAILGMLAGLILAVGSVIAVEAMNTTVRGSKDIETSFGASPIATIPVVQNAVSRSVQRYQMMLWLGGSVLVAVTLLTYLTLLR